MIFFLVSASVPIDIRGLLPVVRCAARRGLFTRALWIRGRWTADMRVARDGQPDETTNAGRGTPNRGRPAPPRRPGGSEGRRRVRTTLADGLGAVGVPGNRRGE